MPYSRSLSVQSALCPGRGGCDNQREEGLLPGRGYAIMTQADSFTLGLIQMVCTPDPAANLDRALNLIRKAAREGAQIVCLQELFRTPYFCQRQDAALFDLAE